jgi:hypothetical protein
MKRLWVILAVAGACGPKSQSTETLGGRLSAGSGLAAGLSFGDVTVGKSQQQGLDLFNSGSSALTVTQSAVAGADFSVAGLTLPLTLAPNQAATVNVIFSPTANGTVQGALTLTSNAVNSPTSFPLSGAGVGGPDAGTTHPYSLWLSSSPSRSAPQTLESASVSGLAYVFTSDATGGPNPAGIQQVSYWLDDPTMASTPTHVEHVTPYDFAGTATDGTGNAQPWDTSTVAAGTHTITQAVTPASGSAALVFTATFQVKGGSPGDSGTAADAGQGDAGPPPACPSTAVPLSKFGAAGAGNDDTSVLQSALDSTASAGQVLRIGVPQSAYHTRQLQVPSNAHVCFDPGVLVEASPGYTEFEIMWDIGGASNVELLGNGATFHMNPSEWSSDPDPEYRHCVSINGSSNVHVANLKCMTFGGDGIYLAGNSANALVEDVTADGCARDGLTVISAKNSTIERCNFINGHTAVDMEPNGPTDALDGVILQDSSSSNNNYGGVNVSTYAYTSATPTTNVIIRRHHDSSEAIGNTDFHAGTSYSVNGTNGVAFSGSVLFDSCVSENTGSRGAWVAWWTANGANVTFQNLTIINPNQNGTAVDGAAVAVGRGGGGVGDQGNAYFLGTSVSDTQGKIARYFTFYDGSGQPFSNVKFLNPGTLSGATQAPPNGLLNGAGVNTVDQ